MTRSAKPKRAAKPKRKRKAPAPAPRARKRKTYPTLEMYLDNVAPNAKQFGLDRALDTCVSMFQYEMHDDYALLKREAQAALDGNDLEAVLALARKRRIAGLDAASAAKMLRDIAGAGEPRYEGAGE